MNESSSILEVFFTLWCLRWLFTTAASRSDVWKILKDIDAIKKHLGISR